MLDECCSLLWAVTIRAVSKIQPDSDYGVDWSRSKGCKVLSSFAALISNINTVRMTKSGEFHVERREFHFAKRDAALIQLFALSIIENGSQRGEKKVSGSLSKCIVRVKLWFDEKIEKEETSPLWNSIKVCLRDKNGSEIGELWALRLVMKSVASCLAQFSKELIQSSSAMQPVGLSREITKLKGKTPANR